MHAYLLVGKNEDKINQEVGEIAAKIGGRLIEFSIGKIENVRELSKFLNLSQTENIIILIKNADDATTESANAFLKNLEEPGANIYFILTATREFSILPTIASRSQIIRIGSGKKNVTSDIRVENFISGSTSERLSIIDQFRKRDEAIIFLKDLMYSVHEKLKSGNNARNLSNFIEIVQESLNALNANGNVAIQFLNLVVQLDKLSSIRHKQV